VTAPATAAKTDSTEEENKKEKDKDESTAEKSEVKSGNSFGDILKESKADEGDGGEKVQMTEKDGEFLLFLLSSSIHYVPRSLTITPLKTWTS